MKKQPRILLRTFLSQVLMISSFAQGCFICRQTRCSRSRFRIKRRSRRQNRAGLSKVRRTP